MTLRIFCVLVIFGTGVFGENPYFLQINDLHYDSYYWTAQASCNEQIDELGQYGDYRCDAPWSLVESSVQALKQHGPSPDFILWSGDLLAHFKNDSAYLTDDYLLEITQNVTDLLLHTFPGVSILPVIGNHDYVPRNQLPDTTSDLYKALGEMWEPLLEDADIVAQFKQGGFYSKQLSESRKVRAVVPNSNFYYTSNSLDLGEDPGGQFAWLEETLEEAQRQQEKVYVLTHISPGILEVAKDVNFFAPQYNSRFLEILQKFSDVILGVFTGHSHMDSFKLVYKDDEPATAVFIAPSVTPWQARLANNAVGSPHNPAVRKVVLSTADYSIEDIIQYYLDLPKANQDPMKEWTKLYEFKELYGMDDMSAGSLETLLEDFKDIDSEKFQNYYNMNTVNLDAALQGSCDCSCKINHVCSMKHVDLGQYGQCMEEPGFTCSGANPVGSLEGIFVGVTILVLLWIN